MFQVSQQDYEEVIQVSLWPGLKEYRVQNEGRYEICSHWSLPGSCICPFTLLIQRDLQALDLRLEGPGNLSCEGVPA